MLHKHKKTRAMEAVNTNSSEPSNITLIFEKFFIEFYKDYTAQQKQAAALKKTLQEEEFKFAYLYILVMFGIFTFIIITMLASTVRSRRQEHTEDPYHTYIVNDARKWRGQKALKSDFKEFYINETVVKALQNLSDQDETVTVQKNYG
ncbi:potassium voltage-gated channel subfamily E member 2 isoform X1 [Rhincodon typus]|uniref:potassium voltage-gated channel subfamily E member 2 isoform X1 n=1 Tax=Rhincodon typus TaxID=259920 RepID=UPI00202E733A|nr:potassium voltage-gated channel subfamily E member 2 isoform X1 [Rhincodon typus]